MHHAAWATIKPNDCGDHAPTNRFGIRSRSWIDRKQAGQKSVHGEMQGAHQSQAQAGEVCQGCMASEDQTDGDEVMTATWKSLWTQDIKFIRTVYRGTRKTPYVRIKVIRCRIWDPTLYKKLMKGI